MASRKQPQQAFIPKLPTEEEMAAKSKKALKEFNEYHSVASMLKRMKASPSATRGTHFGDPPAQ